MYDVVVRYDEHNKTSKTWKEFSQNFKIFLKPDLPSLKKVIDFNGDDY